jgi:MtaA/CmuA family methyltransferase
MAKVQSAAVDRMGYDWTWLQVDDCILFEQLGVGVVGQGNILRATKDYRPATRATLNSLKKPNVKKSGRCPVLLDAIKRMKDKYGDTLMVVGRTEGPFSSVGLLYGIEATNFLLFEDRALLADTTKFFVDLQTEFGLAQFAAGADALWYGDCNASSHLMSLQTYREVVAGPLGEVAQAYRKAGGITILHASEEKPDYARVMAESGVDVVSIGPGGNLAECHAAIAKKAAVIGNVDPIGQLMNGTPASVAAQVEDILHTVSVKGGHLINSGEMVPRDCPEANIRAFGETVRALWPKLAR